MTWISRRKVMNQLGVSEPVLNALVSGGLLGYTMANMVSDQALLQYELYGTQWAIDERYGPNVQMINEDVYENAPPVESIGPQPPATRTHAQVWQARQPTAAHSRLTDTGWIFHFYLVPNYFYWPDPYELALIGEPPLKLTEPRVVTGTDLPVTLYPHPSGCVGLVVVEGLGCPLEDAHQEAYDVAMPLLDELSVRYDVPLPLGASTAVESCPPPQKCRRAESASHARIKSSAIAGAVKTTITTTA